LRCLVLSNNREFRPAEGPVATTSRDHTLTVDPSIHRSIDQSSVRIAVKQEDPDRLLLAVQKPAIEANSATVESEVTVSWRTGPSATTSSYTVSCFSGDQWTCATYPDAGQGFTASGELEKAALPSTVDETFTFAQAGTLTGLTDGDEYKCWVIAVNSVDSVCSAPVQYTLPLAPGAPTNVVPDSTASGEISFTWTDGTAGIPEETYTIKCTDDVSVTDCLSTNGTVQETGPRRAR